MAEQFEGRLEIDDETGAIRFYVSNHNEPLLYVSNLPKPLPLMYESESLHIEALQVHCTFETGTGTVRSWRTKEPQETSRKSK